MNRRVGYLLLCGAWLAGNGALAQEPAAAGAQIDETKVAKTYYVDPSNADAVDDPDHGTEESPFKTVARAIQAAAVDQDRGIGVKVILADGVYREAVHPPPGRETSDAPLVIEAANREQAIIDGADSAGWETGTWIHDGAHWTHPWAGAPPKRPPAPAGAPGRLLPGGALIFLGGQALRQVAEPVDVEPGEYCVVSAPEPVKGRRSRPATAPPASGMIVIAPPGDGDLEGANPELSVVDRTFTLEGRRNIIIRGITFQHSAGSAIVLNGCSNVLIDDVLCQWNNDAGLRISGRKIAPWSADFTLRRVRLLYNGGSGLEASNLKDLQVEDSETSFNGFHGLWSGYIDPAGAAGAKVSDIHGGSWQRDHAVSNSARGIWWGSDCAEITVEDTFCRANQISGFFFEDSAGPFTVRHCMVTGTKSPPRAQGEAASPAAVSICAASNVTLEGNTIAGNEMAQLGVWDVAARTDAVNFESGAHETHRAEQHRYHHNVFGGLNAEQPIFDLPIVDRSGKGSFDFYYGSLDADENCYWNPALTEVFCSFDKGYVRRPGVDLAAWRTFLASRAAAGKTPDGASVWADPLFTDPTEGDFRLGSGSPAADWGLPSDEGSPGQ